MYPKQKMYVLLAMLLILALACNLSPQGGETPQDPGAVDTMVAQTVAASGGQQATLIDPETGQGDSGGQQPPPGDSAPTETATFTPEPTATATMTPTDSPPPPSAIDALNLGSPDATYNFNNAGTFFTYNSADSKVEIKDGTLQFTMKNAVSWTIWSFSAIELEDYYFEINVKMPDDCVGADRGGIIFGTPPGETDNGANYQISCDGRYRLFIYDGAATDTLVPWTSSSEIMGGPGKTNRLGVLHKDNKITLYMNGVKLTTVTDNTYVGEGRIGINMGADEHDNLTIYFDDAAYWTSIP